jgi:hypothetical protein
VQNAEVAKLLAGIHQEIAAVRDEFVELRNGKRHLEKMVAEGLLKFVGRIDAESFKVIYAVLVKGDVAKAARELEMKDGTLREFIARWKSRGKDYAVLADLVRWRKQSKFRGTVPLNQAVIADEVPGVSREELISDVLDELLGMTAHNWQERREKLAELLRPAVRRG